MNALERRIRQRRGATRAPTQAPESHGRLRSPQKSDPPNYNLLRPGIGLDNGVHFRTFARTIDAAKKYVVSSTLEKVDWNAELVRGDLERAVRQLKREPGKGLLVGGVKLPIALAELGLIDEYEFVVHPRIVGHGPALFAGLSKHIDLRFVSRLEFSSGAVATRYQPREIA